MKRAASQYPYSNKKMNTNNTNNDVTDFLFRSPFKPEQQANAIQHCLQSIHRDFDYIKSHGFDEFTKLRDRQTMEGDDGSVHDKTEENLGAPFEGTLRDYQIFMLERAKVENIIVHLGTGMGKKM